MKTSEPMAYAVFCPIGHEFDYLIFTELQDAENKVVEQEEMLKKGEPTPEIIPLYPREKEKIMPSIKTKKTKKKLDPRDYADQCRLTKEDLKKLQNGESIAVTYRSPLDIMIGHYETVNLLIIPSKE